MIRLLIGGSPCTHWSISQKNNRETEPQGLGWELFKNFLIAKEKFAPDFFLYENNKSAAQPIKDQIAEELGVDLMYINSALVSAQNRERFYAFNWQVDQPKDRGIVLRDILESGGAEREKTYPLDADTLCNVSEEKNSGSCPVRIGTIENEAKDKNHDSKQYRVYSPDGKSTTQCGQGGGLGAKTGLYACPAKETKPNLVCQWGKNYAGKGQQGMRAYSINGKSCTIRSTGTSPTLSTGSMVTSSCATTIFVQSDKPIYEVKNGLITIKGKQYPSKLADGFYIIRKLTPVECERLQTLPDGYTQAVSNAQRYKGLGNGWTAEVIIHILNGALKDVPRDEKIVVLSMYDGIGTGRYCLDKMGFKNVEYYAYEIDKYAMQISSSNYPDIVQLGDAFALRSPEWELPHMKEMEGV